MSDLSPRRRFPRRTAEQVDRDGGPIRLLPDEVLHAIFSLLPATSIARAGAVSKRWNHLYRTLRLNPAALVVDYRQFDPTTTSAAELAGSVGLSLRLLGGNNLKLFKLVFHPSLDFFPFLKEWLCRVADKRAEEVELDFHRNRCGPKMWYRYHFPKLPSCILRFNTITRLMIGGLEFSIPSDFVGFGLLTELCLVDVKMTAEMLERAIATSPFLENLHLKRCRFRDVVKIFGANLQLFTYMDMRMPELHLDAPRLRVFHFNGGFNYVLGDLPCLIDAILFPGYGSFVDKITGVEVLTLTALPHWKTIPIFLPITFLHLRELQLLVEVGLDFACGICHLFEYCVFPVLEKLFIEFDVYRGRSNAVNERVDAEPPNGIFYNLKMVKISNFRGYHMEVFFVKFLLVKSLALELLLLVAPFGLECETELHKMRPAFEKLLHSPRASLEAQLLLIKYEEDDEKLVPTHTKSHYAPNTN